MTEDEILTLINKVDGLGGMTVNERLFHSNLFPEFEQALKHDKPKAKRILELLKVDNPSIELILK